MQDSTAAIKGLINQLEHGTISAADFAKEFSKQQTIFNSATKAAAQCSAAIDELTGGQQQLASAIQQAASASATATSATANVGTAARSAGGSFRNFSTIVQQGGYAIGDFASTSGSLGQKLMSISNNVQFAAAGFGPWGVAVGVASVGVAALVQNWDALTSAFSSGGIPTSAIEGVDRLKEAVEKLRQEIEEIRKNPRIDLVTSIKLQKDEQQLKAFEDTAKEIKAVEDVEGPSKAERERGSAFTEAMREARGQGRGQ
jgi:hypothetical protein